MLRRIALSLIFGMVVFTAYADSQGVVAQLDLTQGWSDPVNMFPLSQVRRVQVAGAQTYWFLGTDAQNQETMISGTALQTPFVVPCPFANISAVMPAYPETGESAAAWVITPPGTGTIQSYYFDGREWSQPQTLDSYPSGFQSSQGSGWIINVNPHGEGRVSYFDAGSKTWVQIPSLLFDSDISDAAANGYLYILSEDANTHDLVMYKIDGVGHWEQLNLQPITTDQMRLAVILAENNTVFLYRATYVGAISYYSNDGGESWHDISQNAPIVSGRSEQANFSIVNGIVRIPGQDAYGAYINLNQNSIWHVIPLPPSYYQYFTFYPNVSPDGLEHCEFLYSASDQVTVGCYDIGSQSWNITPIVPLSEPDLTMIAALGHDKVTFIGKDEAGVETGFYYNGSAWLTKKFTKATSFSGSVTTSYHFNTNNIWAGGTQN